MKEYILRFIYKKCLFKEVWIEVENKEIAIQLLNKEHTKLMEKLRSEDLTSNLYEIIWIDGI